MPRKAETRKLKTRTKHLRFEGVQIMVILLLAQIANGEDLGIKFDEANPDNNQMLEAMALKTNRKT